MAKSADPDQLRADTGLHSEYAPMIHYGKCPKLTYTNISDKIHTHTVQIQIWLLLMEVSDRGLHCLLLQQVFCDTNPYNIKFRQKSWA